MLASFDHRRTAVILAASALTIAIAIPGSAAPGDLDPTFDGDGKVITQIAEDDGARGVAIQADGKIVAAGSATASGNLDFALARYNTDGSLDTSFDGDGKVTTDFAAGADEALAVAIQADGKIVAGGSAAISGVDFALTRYNSDGSLDPTFEGDGRVTERYGFGSSQIRGLAIQGDGKIVAAGYGSAMQRDFFLVRFLPNGSIDPTFSGDGRVTFLGFGPPPNQHEAHSVAIQADGKIVAAGCTNCSSSAGNFALVRLNPDGSLDGTFDGDAKAITDFGGNNDDARAVALQTDGKIVAAGSASGGLVFALARYNADGSLDMGFDSDGKVTTNFASGDQARDVAIQPDGKIVAAGLACGFCFPEARDFGVARYNADGSLDTTFSGDGKVTTDFGFANELAFATALQSDGKIVAAGVAGGTFALARYKVCRVTSRRTSIPCR
jgi:uncharacterized delta-60 repeat protein